MPLHRQANLLAIANVVHHVIPVFNAMTISAMVDRWRPETHSFHLLCGDMMVTLKDVAMILVLLIRGRPITGRVDSATWRKTVAAFVGHEPPVKVLSVKGCEDSVRVRWLHKEFQECPRDADKATVTLYARAWV
jgi:hypothetical protein